MMDFAKNILRILQLLWAFLLTALLGNVIANNQDAATSAESAINYSMYATVLAWLAAIWGLASHYVGPLSRTASSGVMGFVVLGLDGAATLFTLIAGIVLAAKLRAVNCGATLDSGALGSSWIGFGSSDNEKRCREIQASTAFMWFLALCLGGSLALTLAGAGMSRRYGPASTVGSSAPMSQVRV